MAGLPQGSARLPRRKQAGLPVLALLSAACCLRLARPWAFCSARAPAPGGPRPARLGLRATGTEDVAEAQLALEQAKMELEAAKLRKEVEEMERQNAIERRASRARQLMGEGRDSLDEESLATRLETELSLSPAQDQLRWLMDRVKEGAEVLTLHDLQSEAFQGGLDTVTQQIKEEERRALREQQEQAQREREANQKRVQEEAASSQVEEVDVDDRGVQTRALGCLAYVLPLLDSLQYGYPLLQFAPFLLPLYSFLSVPNALLNAIPFGPLIVFFVMTILAGNPGLPRLLRFNIQQAVLLDVFLFIPSLIVSLIGAANGGDTGGAVEAVNIAVFLILFVSIAYSVVCTVLGKDPDGLPFVSDATRRGIDRSR